MRALQDFRLSPSKPLEAQRGRGNELFQIFIKGLRVSYINTQIFECITASCYDYPRGRMVQVTPVIIRLNKEVTLQLIYYIFS